MSKINANNMGFLITNHRKKESEIVENEFYSTHKNSVRTFLTEFLKDNEIKRAWEPCAGLGNITKILINEFNIPTISSDLIQRDVTGFYLYGNKNFLLENKLLEDDIDTIITNPPFKLANKIILKAIQLKPKFVIMYTKLTFLEGKDRYNNLYSIYKPTIYLHSSRQGCSDEGLEEFQNGGACAFCWLVWDTSSLTGDSIFKWLPPNS